MPLVVLEGRGITKGRGFCFGRQFSNYFVACHLATTPFKFNLSLVDWIAHIWNVLEETLWNIWSILQMNSTEQNKCGDSTWRAAGNSLHKKKNLCETGLEIAGCRHSMAQKAVNMIFGEIYGYAHYLQKTYFIPKKVKYFWYDVVCKYWPWLKKNDGEVSEKMKPALSIMHAKAHSWSCQVSYWNSSTIAE